MLVLNIMFAKQQDINIVTWVQVRSLKSTSLIFTDKHFIEQI